MLRNMEAGYLRKSWRNYKKGAICGKINKRTVSQAYSSMLQLQGSLGLIYHQKKNYEADYIKRFSLCMKKTGNHREQRDTTSDAI